MPVERPDAAHPVTDWLTSTALVTFGAPTVLAAQPVPWRELTGSYRDRLRAALTACDALLAAGWTWASSGAG